MECLAENQWENITMKGVVTVLLLCLGVSISSVSTTFAETPLYEITKKRKKSKKKKIITGLKNKKLQKACNEWYGAKYKYGGCSKSGVDCSCFVKTMYKIAYGKDLQRSSKNQYKACKPVKKWKKLKEGDLVFFKIGSTKVNHVGIYLKDGKFIHASTKRGVVLSDLNEKYYKKHFFKGGKVK